MRIRIFSLKRRRGMAGERENRILESPLWLFVRTKWIEWEQKILSMQVDDSEFLLYLVWALDSIKEQDERTLRNFRGSVYGAIRKKSIERISQLRKRILTMSPILSVLAVCFAMGLH